jgi:anthranilate synthase/aminodeoxychorismate synthase-like glutamine amidotransferase
MKSNILLIDNYDSFTYNLAQYFWELGYKLEVQRNDKISIKEITEFKPSHIVISPGPGTPNEAGLSLQIIKNFYKDIPILGVCLGHQCIGQHFGGNIIRAPLPMHGKTSQIAHNKKGIFQNIPSPFQVTRYHSLTLSEESVNLEELEITAKSQDDNLIMAIQHKNYPLYGLQFHPESIMTEHGHTTLKNFIEITAN